MKKHIILLLAAVLCAAAFTSCEQPESEKRSAEEFIKEKLGNPAGLKLNSLWYEDMETLADQLDDRLEYFTNCARMDSAYVEYARSSIESYNDIPSLHNELQAQLEEAQAQYGHSLRILHFLDSLKKRDIVSENLPDRRSYLTFPVATYYTAFYTYKDPNGVRQYEQMNLRMTGYRVNAYRYDGDNEWIPVNDQPWFQIPGYYKLLETQKP